MPAEITSVIGNVATSSMTVLGSAITSYWGYILGIGILIALAFKFRGTTRIVK